MAAHIHPPSLCLHESITNAREKVQNTHYKACYTQSQPTRVGRKMEAQ